MPSRRASPFDTVAWKSSGRRRPVRPRQPRDPGREQPHPAAAPKALARGAPTERRRPPVGSASSTPTRPGPHPELARGYAPPRLPEALTAPASSFKSLVKAGNRPELRRAAARFSDRGPTGRWTRGRLLPRRARAAQGTVMRILITNDDGISAPGLSVAEEIAHELAGPSGEVWVVAPAFEQSGVAHAVSLRPPDAARAARGAALRRRGLAGGLRARRPARDPQGHAARPGDLRRQPRPQRRRGHALLGHRRRRHGGGAARDARGGAVAVPRAGRPRRPLRAGAGARRRRCCGGCSTAPPGRARPTASSTTSTSRRCPRPRCAACAPPSRATAPPPPSGCCRTWRRTGASSSG